MTKKKDLYEKAIAYFSTAYPEAETELNYRNGYELLVAVILSAQCTDKRVNMITPALFNAYPTFSDLARSTEQDVFSYIKSISYPNNKARHLLGMAHMIETEFNGQLPLSVTELIRLPGVGRKTANVITSVLDKQPNMAVDTHVFRVSHRIGLVGKRATTPLSTEKELLRYLPSQLVHKAHHWLILHGRYVCKARSPLCVNCGFTENCNYYKINS